MREPASYSPINPATKPRCRMFIRECERVGLFLCFCTNQRHVQTEHSLTLTRSQTLLNPQTACANKTTSFPFSSMFNSGRLIWHRRASTWLRMRTCYKYISIVAEVNRRMSNEMIKYRCHSSSKWVLGLCWCAFFFYLICNMTALVFMKPRCFFCALSLPLNYAKVTQKELHCACRFWNHFSA